MDLCESTRVEEEEEEEEEEEGESRRLVVLGSPISACVLAVAVVDVVVGEGTGGLVKRDGSDPENNGVEEEVDVWIW